MIVLIFGEQQEDVRIGQFEDILSLLEQKHRMGARGYITFLFFSSAAAASAHSTEIEGIFLSLSTFLSSDIIDGSVSHWNRASNYR